MGLSGTARGPEDKTADRLPTYMTISEAAAYLRRSVSWLVRRRDIPYVRGHPNTYARQDLDAWFRRNCRDPGRA